MTVPAVSATKVDRALGQRIRARRRELSISQTALGAAAGITFQQVQKYERGYNRVSFSRLVDIAHALDCRINDLIIGLDGDTTAAGPVVEIPELLRQDGASELLAAYNQAPPALQRAILKLAQAVALDCLAARRRS